MAKKSGDDRRAYVRSIWMDDPRYAVDYRTLVDGDLATIKQLARVDRAKKRISQVPAMGLLRIADLIKDLGSSRYCNWQALQAYLEASVPILGVGFPTAMCMLAVRTDGDYAPMDVKVATGMLALKKISENDYGHLCGQEAEAFAKAYAPGVLKAWRWSRGEGGTARTPKEADEFWALEGTKARLRLLKRAPQKL